MGKRQVGLDGDSRKRNAENRLVFFSSCRFYAHDDARLRAQDEEDDKTYIEAAHSQIGEMMDFLKAYPFITIEDYRWKLSVVEVRLMSYDASRIIYLSDKESKKQRTVKTAQRVDNPMELMTDVGVPVFNDKQ